MTSLSLRQRIGVLAALAIVAYLPALHLPFIADDYTQIPLARHFAAEGWSPLFHEVNLRSRATYMLLDAALDRAFGFTPVAFYTASLLLHVICVLLVYASGVWTESGESVAFCAAAFFAIQEGHQEAVMWPAAAGDLLVFLFGMAAWICWVKWFQGASWKWYAGAIASLLFAAASKESAWIFAALMLLPILFDRRHWRRGIAGSLPFIAIAAIYIIWAWSTRVSGPGYHDNRFSLAAPWFRVLLNSWWRLLFVWGLVAVAILLWTGKRADRRLVAAASLWMLLGLLPYSFLTYMLQIPSRQTYLASAGLAWLVGLATSRLSESRRQTALAIFCVAAVAFNLEILWVKKMAQFQERAQPTELLKQAAATSDGSVTIGCFPLPDFVATAALESVKAKAAFENPRPPADPNCYQVEYKDHQGHVIHEIRRIGTAKHGTFY